MKKVLEVNVDDQNLGGVFALVKNVIENNKSDTVIDIAAIEPFDDPGNISMLNDLGCKVHFIGFSGSKLRKQFAVYKNMKKLLQNEHYNCVHIHADTANKLLVSGLAAKNPEKSV